MRKHGEIRRPEAGKKTGGIAAIVEITSGWLQDGPREDRREQKDEAGDAGGGER